MDEEVNSVRKFFAQRHITLNSEWEEDVIRYIKLNIHKVDEDIESYNLADVIFEQWLYSDFRESTRSDLNIPAIANSFPGTKPTHLQLMSILDISESCYGQYRSNVMDLSNDDSEFHDPSETPQELQKTKHGTKDMKIFLRPKTNEPIKKGMYMFEFTDGNITLKAVLAGSIYGLDHNTLLGAKVLLIPRYVCCNRVLKLTSKNCQFLGGCNEQCMEENSPPLKVFCRKLGMNHEEAFLKATNSKNQLKQTMAATSMLPPLPPPTPKLEPVVAQSLPPPQLDMDDTAVSQPPPLPKKGNETSVYQPLPPQPKESVANQSLPESLKVPAASLPTNPPEDIVYISTYVINDDTVAAVEDMKKSDYVSKQQSVDESTINLSDSVISFPSPPKYQLPKRKPENDDISVFDVSDTTLNDSNTAQKPTLSKSLAIKVKPKKANLDPMVKDKQPPLNKNIQVDNDIFKKPFVPLRPRISNETSAATMKTHQNLDNDGFKKPSLPLRPVQRSIRKDTVVGNSASQKTIQKLNNNGLKKPFLPLRPVQRSSNSDFVPETPAAVYNAAKPSKTLAEINMGPKKLFQSLINKEKNLRKSSLMHHLRVTVKPVDVASVKKKFTPPSSQSLSQLSPEDDEDASYPLTGSPDGNSNQMNDLPENDDYNGSSQQYGNTRKSFGDLLAIDSEDEFMEAVQANNSLKHKTPLRKETSPILGVKETSLIPRKRLAEKSLTPPQFNPRKINFTQPPPGCIERKKNPHEAVVQPKKEVKTEIRMQSPLRQKYNALKLVKLGIVMVQKKFWFKPECRRIQPIFCETDSQLDRKKWTVMVKVSDDTLSEVKMNVDKDLLTNLLGYSRDVLEKALAGKDADEIEKCREKARNLNQIFGRLDLILEVEFSPESSSIPVIRRMSNLAKTLNIV